jgi:hypothetical protein
MAEQNIAQLGQHIEYLKRQHFAVQRQLAGRTVMRADAEEASLLSKRRELAEAIHEGERRWSEAVDALAKAPEERRDIEGRASLQRFVKETAPRVDEALEELAAALAARERHLAELHLLKAVPSAWHIRLASPGVIPSAARAAGIDIRSLKPAPASDEQSVTQQARRLFESGVEGCVP